MFEEGWGRLRLQWINRNKRMTMVHRTMVLLSLAGILLAVAPALSQIKSAYRIEKLEVQLMDGSLLRGALLRIAGDSLILSAKPDRYRLQPGAEITFRLRSVPVTYRAKVQAVTDSTLSVYLVDRPSELHVVERRSVERIQVTAPARVAGSEEPSSRVILLPKIKSIRMHKKGVGTIGFIGGATAGVMLGVAVYEATYSPDYSQQNAVAGALNQYSEDLYVGGTYMLVGIAVGGLVGNAMATSGTRFPIDGNRAKFEAFAQRVEYR